MLPVRILLADDHPLVLEGLHVLLEPYVYSIETVTDGRDLIEAALRSKPDLVIADITLPGLNGIEAIIQIKKSFPGVKVLFSTMHSNTAYLEAALNAGAMGYVVKSSARDELLRAIRSVLDGRIYVSPTLSSEHLERFSDPARAALAIHLSAREKELLQLVAEGRTSKEIACLMKISVKTVAFHRDNVKRKLGVRSTPELTKQAIQMGLVSVKAF